MWSLLRNLGRLFQTVWPVTRLHFTNYVLLTFIKSLKTSVEEPANCANVCFGKTGLLFLYIKSCIFFKLAI